MRPWDRGAELKGSLQQANSGVRQRLALGCWSPAEMEMCRGQVVPLRWVGELIGASL